ncbi:hypothetical protein ThidrDRAFT_0831 [Thiorhodococcus drewsii AZ1]|uniref:Uncharacterized protein n=1 Tax=Thiorhodococcus drewsii AZ1 TaxID=765913 RepID=G2DXV4_9GAMM|nr:hypothetical protein ThidrDRAFT_0831 [Thiorhodococcus drewsii AZ1]
MQRSAGSPAEFAPNGLAMMCLNAAISGLSSRPPIEDWLAQGVGRRPLARDPQPGQERHIPLELDPSRPYQAVLLKRGLSHA